MYAASIIWRMTFSSLYFLFIMIGSFYFTHVILSRCLQQKDCHRDLVGKCQDFDYARSFMGSMLPKYCIGYACNHNLFYSVSNFKQCIVYEKIYYTFNGQYIFVVFVPFESKMNRLIFFIISSNLAIIFSSNLAIIFSSNLAMHFIGTQI